MKKTKYCTAQYDVRRRDEKEWLNEVNIHIKARKYKEEILNLYDYFYWDDAIYLITELCICDLQQAIENRAIIGSPFDEDRMRMALA